MNEYAHFLLSNRVAFVAAPVPPAVQFTAVTTRLAACFDSEKEHVPVDAVYVHIIGEPSAVTLVDDAVPTETFMVICLLNISAGKAE